VKNTLMKESETKYVCDWADVDPSVWFTSNSEITGTDQFARALCQLSQATGQASSFTRQGDNILPRQVKVALDIRLKAQTSPYLYPVDINVVVYYGYCKKYTKYADVDANSATLALELLRLGGEASPGVDTTAFRGYVGDSHLLINTDTWVMKKIVFRLHKSAGVVNGSTGAGVQSANQKVQHSLMLDYASMCPEKLRFDGTQAIEPENWSPVFTMGYYYADNTAPNTGLDGIIEYKAQRHLTFKDF